MVIRLVSASAFVATKLEAFASRGGGDFLTSHDLEDVLNIVDGREELIGELAAAPADMRKICWEYESNSTATARWREDRREGNQNIALYSSCFLRAFAPSRFTAIKLRFA